MKKLVKLLSVLIVSVSVSISDIAKQIVVVGTNAEFAPFEYLDKNEIVLLRNDGIDLLKM